MNTDRPKEAAIYDFRAMIIESWTYERMTDEETARLSALFDLVEKRLLGSYEHRWRSLQTIYTAFLSGLGYSGINWREGSTVTLSAKN